MDVLVTTNAGCRSKETQRLADELHEMFTGSRKVGRKGRPMDVYIRDEVERDSVIVKIEELGQTRRRLCLLSVARSSLAGHKSGGCAAPASETEAAGKEEEKENDAGRESPAGSRGEGPFRVVSAVYFTVVSYMLRAGLQSPAHSTDHTPELVFRQLHGLGSRLACGGSNLAGVPRRAGLCGAAGGLVLLEERVHILQKAQVHHRRGGGRVRFQEIGPRVTLKLAAVEEDGVQVYKHGKNIKVCT